MRLFEATKLNVLQVVNLTLALGVFTSIADNLGDLLKLDGSPGFMEGGGPGKAVFLLLLMFWTMKLFVDDHTHFVYHAKRRFYGAISLLFCTLSFLALITAAEKLGEIQLACLWLLIHFVVLLLWVMASIGTRFIFGDEVAEPADKGIAMRWWWIGSNLLYLVFLAIVLDAGVVTGQGILFMVLMLITIGIDAAVSDTFGFARQDYSTSPAVNGRGE